MPVASDVPDDTVTFEVGVAGALAGAVEGNGEGGALRGVLLAEGVDEALEHVAAPGDAGAERGDVDGAVGGGAVATALQCRARSPFLRPPNAAAAPSPAARCWR